MKKSKLINYTTQDFVSEKELELKLFQMEQCKRQIFAKVKSKWHFKNSDYKGLE